MHFTDDMLLPENQQKLIIVGAPWGPTWIPPDFPEDIAVSVDDQVQKAVDCQNAGASVLHIHVRDPATGQLSTDFGAFNMMIARLREAVPDMVLQIGGSISFAPKDADAGGGWLDYDTRHMITEITPPPDQITMVCGSIGMNIVEMLSPDDAVGTHLADPEMQAKYADMIAEGGPSFYLEHLKRLRAKNIQPFFMLFTVHQLESVERLIRTGAYAGPLNHMLVATGGGAAGRNPFDMMEYIRRSPQGSMMFMESYMRTVPPLCNIAIALGQHCRVGIEDNIWGRKGNRLGTVGQIEQVVRMARELGREVASGPEARQIMRIGEWYDSADQTLAMLGMTPNRAGVGQLPVPPTTEGRWQRKRPTLYAGDSHPLAGDTEGETGQDRVHRGQSGQSSRRR